MITFAAFHMDIRKQDLADIQDIISTVIVKEEPRLYLETALDSCRAKHPALTDQWTAAIRVVAYDGELNAMRLSAWKKM